MKIEVLTLFPEIIESFSKISIVGRAVEKGIVNIDSVNIRDFTLDKHRRVDDYPFGGGAGMLMQAEPIFRTLENIGTQGKKILYLSPKGNLLDKEKVVQLSKEENLVLLCGHYEGIDQRAIDYWNMEEISIGDYILTGGEPAAMVLMDSVIRLLPAALGHEASAMDESIYSGLLEHPQYTKPREFRGMQVPEVLWGGNHKAVHLWQFEEALKTTKERRPDLFKKFLENNLKLSKDEKKIMEKIANML